ncbi:MAG: PAS domain S-box protein [Promethearchaeota archaeon]
MTKQKIPLLTIDGIIQHLKEHRNIEKELKEYEKYNRLITENANDLISIFNNEFEYEYVNESVHKKLLGYRKEDLIGKSLLNIVHTKDQNKTKQFLKDLNFNNEALIEFRIKKSKENYIWVESKGNLVKGEVDQDKILLISRDITIRKKIEQDLIESEEKYKNLVEYSPNSIVLLDIKGNVVDCNRVTEQLLNLPKDKIIGKNVLTFNLTTGQTNPNDVKSYLKKIFRKICNDSLRKPIELEYPNKNNEKIWLNNVYSFVKIGGINYIQVVSEDITELKRAEMLIQEENEKLRKLDELRGNFVNRASHELKTPVTSIYGASDMVLKMYNELFTKYDFLFSSSYKEFLELINSSAKRLKNLTENLLQLSQLDSEVLKLDKKKINISKLMLECIKMLDFQAKNRNITIVHSLSENIEVYIDESHIFRVFQNFISNAIKNTPPNGIIFVKIEKKNKSVEISVRDTGVGLTSEEMEKIFTKFGKVERNIEDIISEGLGFGLYLSKEIVKLHNGEIWAESLGRNKGSTFFVKLSL